MKLHRLLFSLLFACACTQNDPFRDLDRTLERQALLDRAVDLAKRYIISGQYAQALEENLDYCLVQAGAVAGDAHICREEAARRVKVAPEAFGWVRRT